MTLKKILNMRLLLNLVIMFQNAHRVWRLIMNLLVGIMMKHVPSQLIGIPRLCHLEGWLFMQNGQLKIIK